MDEPTAALSPHEVDSLFATVRAPARPRRRRPLHQPPARGGRSRSADVVTVIRDGRHIETRRPPSISPAEIIRLMVGRSLDQLFPKEEVELGDVVFQAHAASRAAASSPTSRSSSGAARSWLSPGSWAPAGPRWRARSSGSTALDDGRLWSTAPVRPSAARAPRCARARVRAGRPPPSGAHHDLSISRNATLRGPAAADAAGASAAAARASR